MRNTTRSDKVDTNSSTEDSIEATTIIAVTIADREKSRSSKDLEHGNSRVVYSILCEGKIASKELRPRREAEKAVR